ncbi:hypothetical protein V1264_024381 [Littorina saxatilis]|uniref:Uncharacterized protein n=1 Tax=Littorina saxatilis TaxID=31220 RepID=A0AAN9AL86_9CAEN
MFQERQLEQLQAKLMPSTVKKSKTQDKEAREVDTRTSFACRFPQEHWVAAEQYFKVDL